MKQTKKSSQKKKPGFYVSWKFEDGSARISLAEYQAQMLRNFQWMASQPEPELRCKGEQGIREIAEKAAAAMGANFHRALNSRAPRPGSQSDIKKRVIDAMRAQKREGTTFKEFLRAWGTDPIDGLRLSIDRESGLCLIFDEDGLKDVQIKLKTMEGNYWSQA